MLLCAWSIFLNCIFQRVGLLLFLFLLFWESVVDIVRCLCDYHLVSLLHISYPSPTHTRNSPSVFVFSSAFCSFSSYLNWNELSNSFSFARTLLLLLASLPILNNVLSKEVFVCFANFLSFLVNFFYSFL